MTIYDRNSLLKASNQHAPQKDAAATALETALRAELEAQGLQKPAVLAQLQVTTETNNNRLHYHVSLPTTQGEDRTKIAALMKIAPEQKTTFKAEGPTLLPQQNRIRYSFSAYSQTDMLNAFKDAIRPSLQGELTALTSKGRSK